MSYIKDGMLKYPNNRAADAMGDTGGFYYVLKRRLACRWGTSTYRPLCSS